MRTGQAKTRGVGRGFTLIEMTVALAVFMLLLLIVFVPLNQAFDAFNAGRADINLQQSAQQTMSQIQKELQTAIFVYPNDTLAGVTDKPPYNGNAPYRATASGGCGGTLVSNTSRLDFLVPKMSNGSVAVPVTAENYIVTYYSRRLIADSTDIYDKVDNPEMLFRAQMPYQFIDGTAFGSTDPHTNTSNSRYASSNCNSDWLDQQQSSVTAPTTAFPDEVDLSGFAVNAVSGGGTVYGSHTLLTPRGTGLIVPDSDVSLTPETSFICEDTNGDGKIDRVTVNLALEEYEQSDVGGSPRAHTYRLSQVIDLPDIR